MPRKASACVSGWRGGVKSEKRQTGKMCLFHTSYCPRRLPFHCLSQSRPLSFNGSSRPCRSVSYIAPSFISRVLRSTQERSVGCARSRSTHHTLALLRLSNGTDSLCDLNEDDDFSPRAQIDAYASRTSGGTILLFIFFFLSFLISAHGE